MEVTQNKKIAYLLDQQTICIKDLQSSTTTTVNHDASIDFIELNTSGNFILFRDKKRVLHLFDVSIQRRITLLDYCGYVQWVPDSDVVVAQSRSNLCVWYNIKAPDQVTTREINGEIGGIERSPGRTEVLVDEATSTASYALVEELIEFGTAIEKNDIFRAMEILEPLELSPQCKVMWQQLHDVSIQNWNFHLAERCAAALGNVSRARYLHRMAKLAAAGKYSGINVSDNWQIKANLFQLKKEFGKAED
eukprot:5567620-Ditylum_brightwellii.AAC.1